MVLPDFLSGLEQWMRESEAQAEELTRAFLTFNGIGSLFYILIIVAVVPAIGEELLFRGVLQKIILQWTKKPHLAIWITAIAFSALHMQFFGFLPRMLLGVVFGYLFFWTNSLWLPILGHFINNGSVVLMSYFSPELLDDTDISIFEQSDYSMVFYILSLILTVGLIYIIKRTNQQKNTNNQPLQAEP
jgi:membrane protease YdiL (CAAX protease family)